MKISEIKEKIDEIDRQITDLYRQKRYLEQDYWSKINKEYGGAITASLII